MYSREVIAEIRRHGETAWPEECCGLVVEQGVVAGRNLRGGDAFEIDAATLVAAHGRIRGVYHSHCDAPAKLSAADLEAARFWPDVDHVVVRVDAGVAGRVRCHDSDGTVRWTND